MNRRWITHSFCAGVFMVLPFGCANTAQQWERTLKPVAERAETQFSVARLQEKNGNLRQAKELYFKLLEQNPQNAEVHHRLGVVCTRMGEHDLAGTHFRKAIELKPHNAEAFCDYGYALYLKNDLEAAALTLQDALAMDPNHQRSKNNLAMVLGQQGKFDEALVLFRQAVSEAEAHANLAYIYTQAGHGQKAIEHYSKALDLDPELTVAKKGLAQLAELKRKVDKPKPVDQSQVAQLAQVLKKAGPMPDEIEVKSKSQPEPAMDTAEPSPFPPTGESNETWEQVPSRPSQTGESPQPEPLTAQPSSASVHPLNTESTAPEAAASRADQAEAFAQATPGSAWTATEASRRTPANQEAQVNQPIPEPLPIRAAPIPVPESPKVALRQVASRASRPAAMITPRTASRQHPVPTANPQPSPRPSEDGWQRTGRARVMASQYQPVLKSANEAVEVSPWEVVPHEYTPNDLYPAE